MNLDVMRVSFPFLYFRLITTKFIYKINSVCQCMCAVDVETNLILYVKERAIAGITVPVWIQLEDACKADSARETCWGTVISLTCSRCTELVAYILLKITHIVSMTKQYSIPNRPIWESTSRIYPSPLCYVRFFCDI